MGIFKRMKRAIKSRANAAVSKAVDPAKEIDMAILELEQQQKAAYKELLSYKTTAKQLDQEIEKLEQRVQLFEKRAMAAVKQGDDDLAKKCLQEKKTAEVELVRARRDRDEASSFAVELNRSRKKVETRLKILKLKRGTMATQIAAARSGTGDAFGNSSKAFDKFARAEGRIDEDAIEAEVGAELDAETDDRDLDARILAAAGGAAEAPEAGDALAELKAKMEAERAKKKLPAAKGAGGPEQEKKEE